MSLALKLLFLAGLLCSPVLWFGHEFVLAPQLEIEVKKKKEVDSRLAEQSALLDVVRKEVASDANERTAPVVPSGLKKEDFLVEMARELEDAARSAGIRDASIRRISVSPARSRAATSLPKELAQAHYFELTTTAHYQVVLSFIDDLHYLPAAAGALRFGQNGNAAVYIVAWKGQDNG